jgi:hypothetical protein
MIPTYSEAAKAAIPQLTRGVYKAFLFFEDENSENFYEEITKKITNEHRNIRVICLNGKKSLIEHCFDPANSKTKNKTIYILDKDFDDLLKKQIVDNSILYLNQYSIENYLLESKAINRLALEEDPKSNITTDSAALTESHLQSQSVLFLKLSSLFLINQTYSLGIKSCSEPLQRFVVDKKPWLLCQNKINDYEDEIVFALILNGIAASEEVLTDILYQHEEMICDYCHVPGKHILDSVRFLLNKTLNIRIPSRESFAFRLAAHCKLETLDNLRSKIDFIISQQRQIAPRHIEDSRTVINK